MNLNSIDAAIAVLMLKGAALCIAWLLVARTCSRFAAGWLSMWWRAGFLALVGLGAASWAPVEWTVPLPLWLAESGHLTNRGFVSPPQGAFIPKLVGATTGEEAVQAATPASAVLRHGNIGGALTAVWFVGMTALLGRTVQSTCRARRLVLGAASVADPAWLRVLKQECTHARVRQTVALRVHAAARAPFASGLLRPVVILPESCDQWDASERRAVLRHELAHIGQRDLLFRALAEVAVAVYWLIPFIWMARRQLILAQERAADDSVLDAGCAATDYANLLASLANDERHSGFAVMSMARKSSLGARVERLLDRGQRRETPTPAWSMAIITAAVGCALVLAASRLGAQETAPPTQATAPVGAVESPQLPTFTRTYRDTFRLEKSFAGAFPGSAEEALAALRSQLAAASIRLPADAKLELRADKGALVLESADPQDQARAALGNLLQRSGWWTQDDAVFEVRRKHAEARLTPLRDEVDKLRQAVDDAARVLVKLRQADGITDPDPESMQSTVAGQGGDAAGLEQSAQAQAERVEAMKARRKHASTLQPEQLRELMRVLGHEDDGIVKVVADWESAVGQEAVLASSRLPEEDVRRKAIRAQKEALRSILAETHGRLLQSWEAKLENETKKLQEVRERIAGARDRMLKDKQKLGRYIEAKAAYLQARRLFEAAQIKLSTELLESGVGW